MGSRIIVLVPDFSYDKTVLGLDCSSKTVGWGFLSYKPITLLAHGYFNPLPSKYTLMERLSGVFNNITTLCEKFKPTNLAVEDIIQHIKKGIGSSAQTITILAAFNRVASLAAWRKIGNITYYPVSTIRKIIREGIGQSSKIDKEDMPNIIRTHLCPAFSNVISKKGMISNITMDEADGIAVAWSRCLELGK